jgi:serine/threonine protein kinase
MSRLIGRFEILRELGRGAQSIVYLGRDPHLQREVAIKTLHFAEADSRLNAYLLTEARTVSKLRHANIVPIFEAGEQAGDPYLVFEYVEGDSLAQTLKKQPLAPLRAAEMACAILDALDDAHAQGIIHRDLKPSNIIIDPRGAPRVMDFGIAVRVSDAPALLGEALMGTPPYLAPEYVAQRLVNARTDLYAMGLILLEMITGRCYRQARTLTAMLEDIVEHPVVLPENSGIDERLGAIILKATAQDPSLRYESAARMRAALQDYLMPVAALDGDSGGKAGQATVDFLLRRMRNKSDFPVLSDSVSAINRLTHSDKESVNKLSNSILKDYALTAKILRIVNSPFYRQSGGGSISTVSRAVIVLGFDAIRNVALTVMMFEHLQNKANATQIKEAFLRANLSGLLARDIGQKMMPRNSEEAFICAMFHGLGRLLVQYYFPDEVDEMRRLMAMRNCSDDAAMQQVLGTSFEELGVAIGRHWGFPPSVIHSMRRLAAGAVRKPATSEDALQTVAGFANELCDAIADAPVEERGKALKQISARYAAAVHYSDDEFKGLMKRACGELEQMAASLQVNLKQSPFARQARAWSGGSDSVAAQVARSPLDVDSDMTQAVLSTTDAQIAVPPPAAGGAAGAGKPVADAGVGATEAAEAAESVNDGAQATHLAVMPPAGNAAASDAQATLTAGIQDISNSLVEDFSLNDVLRIILETMYRAMGFGRVLLCLRDAKTNQMIGRFGFGVDTGELARHVRFALGGETDVFRVAATKGVDLIITDVDDPKISERIPEWHRKHLMAGTFVLFPLMMKGVPVAMIYCDKPRAGDIVISPAELTLLKTLRNQAVLAIKQAT